MKVSLPSKLLHQHAAVLSSQLRLATIASCVPSLVGLQCSKHFKVSPEALLHVAHACHGCSRHCNATRQQRVLAGESIHATIQARHTRRTSNADKKDHHICAGAASLVQLHAHRRGPAAEVGEGGRRMTARVRHRCSAVVTPPSHVLWLRPQAVCVRFLQGIKRHKVVACRPQRCERRGQRLVIVDS